MRYALISPFVVLPHIHDHQIPPVHDPDPPPVHLQDLVVLLPVQVGFGVSPGGPTLQQSRLTSGHSCIRRYDPEFVPQNCNKRKVRVFRVRLGDKLSMQMDFTIAINHFIWFLGRPKRKRGGAYGNTIRYALIKECTVAWKWVAGLRLDERNQ